MCVLKRWAFLCPSSVKLDPISQYAIESQVAWHLFFGCIFCPDLHSRYPGLGFLVFRVYLRRREVNKVPARRLWFSILKIEPPWLCALSLKNNHRFPRKGIDIGFKWTIILTYFKRTLSMPPLWSNFLFYDSFEYFNR